MTVKMNNSDNKNIYDENNEISDSDDESSLEELEELLAFKDNEIIELQARLDDAKDRIHDLIVEKGSLEKKNTEQKLKELDLKLGKFEELKNDYLKLEHRTNITKGHLDESRNQIKIQEKVIEELANRGLTDYLLRRYPESFIDYKKNRV